MGWSKSYDKKSLRSGRDLHVSYVYQDPEFREAMDSLNREFNIYPGPHIGSTEGIGKRMDAIMQLFCIEDSDIDFYIEGKFLPIAVNRDTNYDILFDNNVGIWNIRVKPGITKAEFDEAWNIIEYDKLALHNGRIPKNKPSEEPDLIYAIFKARSRKQPLTFREIFELYEKGNLPYYKSEPRSRFKSEDSLERYYNKHKPNK
jgi:hypothetical protein